ncbi:MAG: lipoate--protein ligase family protein [Thermoprotei archaeon]|nr:MAG: lipoate--protein ligase family protein [Thermoprotei archaeon]
MGEGYYEYKAKKGLIKAKAMVFGNRIESIIISGDFMIHPEESIWELEKALKGSIADPNVVEQVVREKLNNVEFIGSSVDDFVHVIKKAVEVALNE